MFRNIRVGDNVWDIQFGKGEVVEVKPTPLPCRVDFKVKFENELPITYLSTWYNEEGKRVGYGSRWWGQTLFWEEVEINFSKEKPDFNLDEEYEKLSDIIVKFGSVKYNQSRPRQYVLGHFEGSWECYEVGKVQRPFEVVYEGEYIFFDFITKLNDNKVTVEQLENCIRRYNIEY